MSTISPKSYIVFLRTFKYTCFIGDGIEDLNLSCLNLTASSNNFLNF